ncbi:MAG TPA: cupin domain-containing protein [Ktedonobacteraceae bacterium]
MEYVINRQDLETRGPTSYVFEGYRYGAASVSLHLTDLAPGQGPRLHRHPYEEVFVVYEGQATFTVGDTTLEVTAGQIVVVPAGMPHKFVNSGQGQLRQTSVQPSSHMIAEWLEN